MKPKRMKPDFKELAERYRSLWREAEGKVCLLLQEKRFREADLAVKDREIDNLKTKYRKALDTIIDLQEAILMKEVKTDA